MIRIRLSRTGVRNHPFYRVVVVDSRKKLRGKFLDILGFWFPGKKKVSIDQKKMEKWVGVGAQPSATVSRILTGSRNIKSKSS